MGKQSANAPTAACGERRSRFVHIKLQKKTAIWLSFLRLVNYLLGFIVLLNRHLLSSLLLKSAKSGGLGECYKKITIFLIFFQKTIAKWFKV